MSTKALLGEQLSSDLRLMGLDRGDTVLVRCATRPIAPREKAVASALLTALLDVVGPDGTVVALTFTEVQNASQKQSERAYTDASPTGTGGFASAVLRHPHRKRSGHPTNSIAAIGAHAQFLTEGHREHTKPFSWMERLIECNGKQMLIGCVADSPGLSTVHLIQERLGLSSRSFLAGRGGAFVLEIDGTPRWVPRVDIPGCSMGFGKLYGHYVSAGVLHAGHVGRAYAIMATAADAAAIEHQILAKNPRAVLCDRTSCLSCASWSYNRRRLPIYVLTTLRAKTTAVGNRILGRKRKPHRRSA